jgi:hypothetical protein
MFILLLLLLSGRVTHKGQQREREGRGESENERNMKDNNSGYVLCDDVYPVIGILDDHMNMFVLLL